MTTNAEQELLHELDVFHLTLLLAKYGELQGHGRRMVLVDDVVDDLLDHFNCVKILK